MNKPTIATTISSLLLMACTSLASTAFAQQGTVNSGLDLYQVDNESLNQNQYQAENEILDQAQLDQILAPIALYPDSLLSQILVAATYPLEIVQANRWRQANQSLTENQVLIAIEQLPWDPSVKALTPFTDLLARLSDDLNWLQQIGDSFLANEGQVLASIQDLRQRAHQNGSIADNDYYNVIQDDGHIIIESTNTEIVYVPYYDSRSVYGRWAWRNYQPVYWKRPSHYQYHSGFYWSNSFYIRPTLFYGAFHWGLRNLVVNQYYYDKPYRQKSRYRNLRVSKYSHWRHNSAHRRGVRYSNKSRNKIGQRNKFNSRSISKRQKSPRFKNQRSKVTLNRTRNSNNSQLKRKKVQQVKQRLSNNKRKAGTKNSAQRQKRVTRQSVPVRGQSQQRQNNKATVKRNNSNVNSKNVSVNKKYSKKTDTNKKNSSYKSSGNGYKQNSSKKSRSYKSNSSSRNSSSFKKSRYKQNSNR